MIKRNFAFVVLCLAIACNNAKNDGQSAGPVEDAKHAEHDTAAMVSNDYSDSVNNGLISTDSLKGSPPRSAMATINGNHIHIAYNSPGVRNRPIWDSLVPYNKVWVAGAHSATSVDFAKEVTINGKKIPAGKYAFFTIPGKDKWVLIINSNHQQHQADKYKQEEDLVRMDVTPSSHSMTQRLTYLVEPTGDNAGKIIMRWENIEVSLPFTTP